MSNTTVADTIAQQMGGAGRIRMMTGGKVFATDKGLRIKFPNKSRSKGNLCDIALTPADTYKVTFMAMGKLSAKVVKVYDDVYFDQLIKVFETQTGLFLHL